MSNSRIAPLRPSIARFLKKQIGGFIQEYEREVNRGADQPKKSPEPEKATPTPKPVEKPTAEDGQT